MTPIAKNCLFIACLWALGVAAVWSGLFAGMVSTYRHPTPAWQVCALLGAGAALFLAGCVLILRLLKRYGGTSLL